MKVTVLGCSGSMTGPHSPASSYLVQAPFEGRTFSMALDMGNGALGTLQQVMDMRDLDAVVLSHLHPDHIMDMCGLYVGSKYNPGGARERKLPVYGPVGTEERLDTVYGPDMTTTGAYFEYRPISDACEMQIGPFTVTSRLVHHPIEAYGLRVECEGKVLAYTGDTDICPQLSLVLQDADLALMDCAYQDGRDDDIHGVHMSGSRCAQAALDAGGVKRLMLTHITPWNDPAVCRADAEKLWPGEVELAEHAAVYEL